MLQTEPFLDQSTLTPLSGPPQQQEVLYIEADESITLPRDDWKEVKLGRAFKSPGLRAGGRHLRGSAVLTVYRPSGGK